MLHITETNTAALEKVSFDDYIVDGMFDFEKLKTIWEYANSGIQSEVFKFTIGSQMFAAKIYRPEQMIEYPDECIKEYQVMKELSNAGVNCPTPYFLLDRRIIIRDFIIGPHPVDSIYLSQMFQEEIKLSNLGWGIIDSHNSNWIVKNGELFLIDLGMMIKTG